MSVALVVLFPMIFGVVYATTLPARRLFAQIATHCDGRVSHWSPTPHLHGRYKGYPLRITTRTSRRSAPFTVALDFHRKSQLRIRVLPDRFSDSMLVQPLFGPRLAPIEGPEGAISGHRRCVSNDPRRAAALLTENNRKARLEHIVENFAVPALGPKRITAVRNGYPTAQEGADFFLGLLDDFAALADGFEQS